MSVGANGGADAVGRNGYAADRRAAVVGDEDVAVAGLAAARRFEQLQVGRLGDEREDVPVGAQCRLGGVANADDRCGGPSGEPMRMGPTRRQRDSAQEPQELNRFRGNAFRQRGMVSIGVGDPASVEG